MSFLTQISNKLEYMVSEWASDPEADAYAKEKAQQRAQDEEAQERLNEMKEKGAEDTEAQAKAEAEVKALEERREFKPQRAASNMAAGIIKGFMNFIFILIILYGGHLAANEAIGYNMPFRIMSFIYGCLFFFIQIPRMLIRRYLYQIKPNYYTYFPLSTYEPNGDLEILFLGAFCYKEDQTSQMAKATVENLYKAAFENSQIKSG